MATEQLSAPAEIETYKISEDGKSITCLGCGRTSYAPMDVVHAYCGNCNVFHEDLRPLIRQWWLDYVKEGRRL